MKEPLYIQITKQDELNPCLWYNRQQGKIYPVKQSLQHEPHYRVCGTDYEVAKEHCEVVPLNQQPKDYEPVSAVLLEQYHKEEPSLQAAHDCAKRIEKGTGGHYWSFKKAFYEGYDFGFRLAEERVPKVVAAQTEVVGEDQHLITTDQLKAITDAYNQFTWLDQYDAAKELKAAFPTVFAPAKTTYKVGDRISIDQHGGAREYLLSEPIEDHIALINSDGMPWEFAVKVAKTNHVTEEEMKAYVGKTSFTLLPSTTAQEEYDAHDNALPNALKGGKA